MDGNCLGIALVFHLFGMHKNSLAIFKPLLSICKALTHIAITEILTRIFNNISFVQMHKVDAILADKFTDFVYYSYDYLNNNGAPPNPLLHLDERCKIRMFLSITNTREVGSIKSHQ